MAINAWILVNLNTMISLFMCTPQVVSLTSVILPYLWNKQHKQLKKPTVLGCGSKPTLKM